MNFAILWFFLPIWFVMQLTLIVWEKRTDKKNGVERTDEERASGLVGASFLLTILIYLVIFGIQSLIK